MTDDPRIDRLWNLLPAYLRAGDLDGDHVLQPLLRIASGILNDVEDDLWQRFDDLFIETAADWAIPYIGELVSNDPLFDAARADAARTATALFTDLAPNDLRAPIAARVRADVARTIYYRRRKGAPAMLEELARNVTGWPMHLVECFELLDWPQFVEHLRPQAALLDVRSPERCERAVGAFSDAVRCVDVREPTVGGSRGAIVAEGALVPSETTNADAVVDRRSRDPVEPPYAPKTVAFFGWRLQANPLVFVPARQSAVCPFGWSFSPLGNPAPLFSRWQREGDPNGLVTEIQVPQPIRRTRFALDMNSYVAQPPVRPLATDFYGNFRDLPGAALPPAPDTSITVYLDGVAVAPCANPAGVGIACAPRIRCVRVDDFATAAQPAGNVVGLDVVNGRLLLGAGLLPNPATPPAVSVSSFLGQAAGFGGGGYGRRPWIVPYGAIADAPIQRIHVGTRPRPAAVPPPPPQLATVTAALAGWVAAGRPPTVIVIDDSCTYDLPATVDLDNDSWLVIEAADGERPLLRTPNAGTGVDVVAPPAGTRDYLSTFTLSGVLVEGHLDVIGPLNRLRLWHSTLTPGRHLTEDGAAATADPSITATGDADLTQLRVEIAFSIVGPVTLPPDIDHVSLLDSMVDGLDTGGALAGPAVVGTGGTAADLGPRLQAERSTVIGVVHVAALDASECILTGHVEVQQTQSGCVRFTYLPLDSVSGRRFRCQPELTADRAAQTAVARALAQNPLLSVAQQQAVGATARAAVAAALVPAFTVRQYGRPAYGQLASSCPAEIAEGAEDGSEMGALCHVKQAQRESNLRIRLAEYLPFGLDAALTYVT
jgi:hypothetical protein